MISDIPKLFIKCSQTCWSMMTEKTYYKRWAQVHMFVEGGDIYSKSHPSGCGQVVWFPSGSEMT